MTKKSTTVKTKIVNESKTKIVNESKLKLPQDIGGFSVNFRREAARSVGRIMADDKKLKCFLEMLDVFKQYAEDRFEHQIEIRNKAVADKAVKLKAAQADALTTAEGVIKGKRAAVAQMQREIEAHDVRMEESK